jgi:hypothetical protein|tara:strand:+ start:1190 stop:1633 length:444 start_codon:yes stop_codon:yes gene_type:complete
MGVPEVIAVIGLVMSMKSAGDANKAAKFERQQAEEQKASIRAEALNQETNRRLEFFAADQANMAQDAANNVVSLGGTAKAMKLGNQFALDRDIATIKANAAGGIRTASLQSSAIGARARGQAFAAVGQGLSNAASIYKKSQTQKTRE